MTIKNSILKFVGSVSLFALCAGIAHANVLVNPGFEDPAFVGAEAAGAGNGWTAFGPAFRIQGVPPIGPAGALEGTVVLKVFGEAGVFQDFSVNPTDVVTGTAWVLNDSADPMLDGQIAAVNLEWLTDGAQNGIVSFGSTIDFTAPLDVWTQIGVVGATVPTERGTNGVRLTLITGPFAGIGGGAPRFDAASLELEVQAIPVPAAVWLFGSGLVGLVGVARRRRKG